MKNQLLDAKVASEEQETVLRPSLLNDFIGQNQMKSNLTIFITSSIERDESLDHTLLHGPPGLGKTSIAQIIAKEKNVNLKSTAGPILSKAADLAAILTNLQKNDVLFIDEIHRLNIHVEEILYSAMEDFSLDIMIGEGPSARSVKIYLPKFTLIGATTRLGLISKPLCDRFGIHLKLNFYSCEELTKIVERGAKVLNVALDTNAAIEIANRSRGTPRIALRLLKRVRDFGIYQSINPLNQQITDYALNQLGIDKLGLDSSDHKYLRFIAENYDGGPVGIDTIAAALSEQRDTIEEMIEPYLIQIGFVQRTQRGRVITANALKHLH
ncbi:Holliday junction branch migration DNA helicase RuvB [Orientia tsutsugamushi]|uniref:Holliday junction branch migration DNA helicase RuvB n=1 Tax=Orientia tsutsugamushi TaxID=784 RepID=UPI0005F8E035|nr:Holliday junction branch migration DNA helicase RuvB [Orientia tsutsugamushi]KJV75484.1 holliday junction DNA helicase RuvB [Orientia tsutsugamushi str. TA763]SPP23622.1 Holliday junction branch migration DNA helicase RuvB [Orientia tsutsugamushi]